MKIVCDKCQTKYSIADEKVSGKVFKIRCKKCSHIIVVKGNEGAAAEGPSLAEGDDGATMAGTADAPHGAVAQAAAAIGGDKVWYLVVAGEQVGPFANSEVRTRFAAGEVDGETYAWREGFGDWLRLSTIDDFRDLGAPAGNGAPAGGGETRRTDLGDMFGQHQNGAAHAEEEEGGASDIFGRGGAGKAARGGGDDLFGAAATVVPGAGNSGFGGDDRGRGNAASFGAAGAEASGDKLTGQRNENSVLFSLSNLSAMATAGAAPKQSASSASVPESRPGYATARNEGSGLIDIRAMAAATLSSASTSSGQSDHGVEIPSFSAAPVFTPVVAAPVMMPTPQSGMPKWAWAVIGVGAAAVLGLGGLATALVLRKPDVVQQPPQLAMAAPAAAPAAGANAIAAPVAAAPAPTAPAAAAPAAAAPAEANHLAAGAEHHGGPKHAGALPAPHAAHGGGAAPVAAAPRPAESPKPAPVAVAESKPKKAKAGGGGDSLDDLLNDASPSTKHASHDAPAAAPADDPNLPDQLERGDVLAGMKAVQPRVMGCYAQYHVPGVAMVSLTIGKSGHVSVATVGGALSGTPTGDCVSKAVKGAAFRKFKGAAMSIQYPFQLR